MEYSDLSASAIDNRASLYTDVEDEGEILTEQCLPFQAETHVTWEAENLVVAPDSEFIPDSDSTDLEQASADDSSEPGVPCNDPSSSSVLENALIERPSESFSNSVNGAEETVPGSSDSNESEATPNSTTFSSRYGARQDVTVIPTGTGWATVWRSVCQLPNGSKFGKDNSIRCINWGELIQLGNTMYLVHHEPENNVSDANTVETGNNEHQVHENGPPSKIPRLDTVEDNQGDPKIFDFQDENLSLQVRNKIAELVCPNSLEPIDTSRNSEEAEKRIQDFTQIADEHARKAENSVVSPVDSAEAVNELEDNYSREDDVCDRSERAKCNESTNVEESNRVETESGVTGNTQEYQPETSTALSFSNETNISGGAVPLSHAPSQLAIEGAIGATNISHGVVFENNKQISNMFTGSANSGVNNLQNGESTSSHSTSVSTEALSPSTSASTLSANQKPNNHVDYYYVKLNKLLEEAKEAMSLKEYDEDNVIKVFGRPTFLAVFSKQEILGGTISGRPEKGKEMEKFSGFQIGVISRFLGFLVSQEEHSWENFRVFADRLAQKKLNGLSVAGFKYFRESILVKYASEMRIKLRKEMANNA